MISRHSEHILTALWSQGSQLGDCYSKTELGYISTLRNDAIIKTALPVLFCDLLSALHVMFDFRLCNGVNLT